MKICSKCKIEKNEPAFSKNKNTKDGLNFQCKSCVREYKQANAEKIAEQQREYQQANAEKIAEQQREYRQANAEKIAEYRQANAEKIAERKRKYQQANAEKIAEQQREYYQANAEKIAEYYQANAEKIAEQQREYRQTKEYKAKWNERYQANPSLRIAHCLSGAIRHAIKAQKAGRKWETLVGYKVDDLMQHLEAKFTPEMNWENQGSYWHIDHIRPKSWFDQLDPEQFKACWALENLQPLEATENIKKGNRYEG